MITYESEAQAADSAASDFEQATAAAGRHEIIRVALGSVGSAARKLAAAERLGRRASLLCAEAAEELRRLDEQSTA